MLSALHDERRMIEGGILSAVVEVQMRIDHHRHVDRCEIVSRESVGDRAVHNAVLAEDFVGTATPGVDEDGSEPLMQDHVAVNGPLRAHHVQVPEIEAFDLHQFREATPQQNALERIEVRALVTERFVQTVAIAGNEFLDTALPATVSRSP